MEAFKGQLAPDGNRSDSVKAQAGFTARRVCRAVGKPELSEPTLVRRIGEDHQPKATPGMNSEIRVMLSNLAAMRDRYGL